MRQLDVVAGRAHRDRQRPPVHAQLQRLLGGQHVLHAAAAVGGDAQHGPACGETAHSDAALQPGCAGCASTFSSIEPWSGSPMLPRASSSPAAGPRGWAAPRPPWNGTDRRCCTAPPPCSRAPSAGRCWSSPRPARTCPSCRPGSRWWRTRSKGWDRCGARRRDWPRSRARRRRPSCARPTCRSCTPRWSAGCCADSPTPSVDVVLPVARGYRQPLAAGYRTALAGLVEKLLGEGRPAAGDAVPALPRRPARRRRAAGRPELARHDPELDSLVNVNEPDDYAAALARPEPEVVVERFGALAGGGRRGPRRSARRPSVRPPRPWG